MKRKEFISKVHKDFERDYYKDFKEIYLMERSRAMDLISRTPKVISEFIIMLLEENSPNSIINIWSRIYEAEDLLIPLVNHFKPDKIIANEQLTRLFFIKPKNYDEIKIPFPTNKNGVKLIKLPIVFNFENYEDAFDSFKNELKEIDKKSKVEIDWRFGYVSKISRQIKEKFDLIICNIPPFYFFVGEKKDRNNDKVAIKHQLDCLRLLDPDGYGIFIIPWCHLKNVENFNEILSDRGYYIEGAFPIFDDSMVIGKFVEGYVLFVIRKGELREIFVGELNSNKNFVKKLIDNFKQRKRGLIPQLGFFIEPKFHISFHRLIINKTIKELSQKQGYKKYDFRDLILEKNQKIKKEKENAIYLSKSLEAYDHKSEIEKKSENYSQYILNSDYAIDSFVCDFLNSSLGRKITDTWKSLSYHYGLDGVDREIEKDIYLPPLKKQYSILALDKKINRYILFLKDLKIQLWEHLEDSEKIKEIIEDLKIESTIKERFLLWIEKLPYPLSSILWLYISEDTTGEKIDHLFHFFEAFAIFFNMIFLNIFAINEDFYNKNKNEWIKRESAHKDWIEKPTLGSWVYSGKKLSSILEKFLNEEAEIELLAKKFRVNKEFLFFLCDRKIFGLLDQITEYRNLWKGHGGVVSERESARRFRNLENLLLKLQRLIGDFFQQFQLTIAGSMEYKKGVFHTKVKKVIGSRTPFKTEKIVSLDAMEKGKLYFKHKESKRPIPIKIPLLKIIESPEHEKNACYFYNRRKGEEVRFISYHFRPQDTRKFVIKDVESIFEYLK